MNKTNANGFVPIDQPYTLVIPIPCFVDESGAIWLERSWNHDLVEHLSYLRNFVLCAPRVRKGTEPDLVRFEPPAGTRIAFAFLPPQTSYLRAWVNIPRTAFALWRAIGRTSIVHSGVNGWPYPLAWIANPIALLRRKRLVINVESDWKYNVPGRESLKDRLLDMDPIRFRLARYFCNRADLALFTQSRYLEALCTRAGENAYVTPAVWVNDEDILTQADGEAAWALKLREPVRLLFAGRLALAKGTAVLLEALRRLEARGSRVRVDIIGQGDERDACVEVASQLRSVRLRVLDPVPYGKPFFDLLRGYHALLVPSLTNEQPRVVFDANAQAVPVIAADTDGLRPHVEHEKTGWLVHAGDVEGLAAAITRADSSVGELRALGLEALRATHGNTHKAMHRRRSQLLAKHCS